MPASGISSSVHRRGGDSAAGSKTRTCCANARDRQVDVDAGEFLRRDGGARFHHHFEPETEAIGVELLVQAWLGRAPQVEVEDRRQLAGCRQRHELAAILESAVLDDAVQHLRWQSRDDVREVRRVQNPIEQRAGPGLSRGAGLSLRRAGGRGRGR